MSKAWLKTGYIKAAPVKIDRETSTIHGVKVCTVGEAKGHGVSLDSDFVKDVIVQGNSLNKGLKARFGHPTMCSEAMGTFIGRFHNFSAGITIRDDGTKAQCAFADLVLSESAKETPNGDLHNYVLSMAEHEADMFGTSIVFTEGSRYRRDATNKKVYPYNQDGERNDRFEECPQPDYMECAQLRACDCVDEPAANDGLFSAFAGETVAGQLAAFLDEHPDIFHILQESPQVMAAIAEHGEKIDQFFTAYKQYCPTGDGGGKLSTPTTQEGPMPQTNAAENTSAPGEAVDPAINQSEHETAPVQAAAAVDDAQLQAAVATALADDRKRAAAIEELGEKFGFSTDAKKFKEDGSSVAAFQAHILEKSPEDWRASLSVKNPVTQRSEQELDDDAGGAEAVATIKARRDAKFSHQ